MLFFLIFATRSDPKPMSEAARVPQGRQNRFFHDFLVILGPLLAIIFDVFPVFSMIVVPLFSNEFFYGFGVDFEVILR